MRYVKYRRIKKANTKMEKIATNVMNRFIIFIYINYIIYRFSVTVFYCLNSKLYKNVTTINVVFSAFRRYKLQQTLTHILLRYPHHE